MLKSSPNFVLNNKNYKILTPDGYENFVGVNKITKNCYIHLVFSNGSEINCSEDHPFLTIDGLVKAKDLNKKIQIETKDGFGCFVTKKRKINKKIDLYDIVNSGERHLYYSNDIVSHNCSFLGSTNTLITGEKLATLAYKEPIKKHSDMVIYEDVVKEEYSDDTGELLTKDHTYVICADVSEGKNLDYSAFSVFDISVMPYRQVARYRNNALPPILYPSILKSCAEYYNNAYVLIEVNNNPQVADLLLEDLEYENVLQVASGNKRAQTVVINKGTNVARGVKMTPLVKRIGCSTLKTLIENDKLVINDFETISELTTFVVNGPSFAAEEGCNDDLAMVAVIFSWLTTQKFFKELVEHDLRKMLQYEHFNYVEEEQIPAPIVTTGLEFDHFVEDGAVWIESSSSDPYGKLYKELFNF